MSSNICISCGDTTSNNKFCSRSCAAKHNNKGVRRHGKPPSNCKHCGKETKSSRKKFCSNRCQGDYKISQRSDDFLEQRLKSNREVSMRYYANKVNQTPPDADLKKIKEIYLNCPDGYEVDHIHPISKGGLHHQDNLQYLTISENRSKGSKLNWRSYQDSNPD